VTTTYSGSNNWSLYATTSAATSINLYGQLPYVYNFSNVSVLPAVQRQAPPLGFNKFINASDMLEGFIAFLGAEGVRQGEVMGMPLDHFIKWLIIKACEADGEEADVVLALPAPKRQSRCLGCQRFIPISLTPQLHDERCAGFYFQRQRNSVEVNVSG